MKIRKHSDPNKNLEQALITKLYYWKEDIQLIMETICRDGEKYTNIDLLRRHMKDYEEICKKLEK